MSPCVATALLAWALLASTAPHAAQPTSKDGFWKRVFSSPDAPVAERLFFNVTADISLPGPLPGPGPILSGDSISLPVAGGLATTGWAPGSEPTIEPNIGIAPVVVSSEEPESDEVTFRARFLDDGKLLLEKRCKRCKRGWSKKWKLRIPGNATVPPLITEHRVYFGAPDNRVYCLQKSNGYRVWDVDVGSRISSPLVIWSGRPISVSTDNAHLPRTALILALPDNGARLIALDARTGQEVARFELPPDGGRIRTVPLETPDGKIIIAMEKYNTADAALIVFELSRSSIQAEVDALASDTVEDNDSASGDDSNSVVSPKAALREKRN